MIIYLKRKFMFNYLYIKFSSVNNNHDKTYACLKLKLVGFTEKQLTMKSRS